MGHPYEHLGKHENQHEKSCRLNGNDIFTGWKWHIHWLVAEPTPLKHIEGNWDDKIPKMYGKNMFQTTNQLLSMGVHYNSSLS